MEKGFVAERTEGAKKVFQALDPIRIKEYIDQKAREVDAILPELQRVSARGAARGEVSISQGALALRSVFMSLLDNKKEEITIYGIPSGMRESLGEGFLNDFHDKRIESGIPMRNIYAKNVFNEEVASLGNRAHTEVRYEKKTNPLGVATIICGDRVFIVVFRDIISIIEIISEEIAEAYRGYFDVIWKDAGIYQSV
jgi:sugar-specific transcriptional regulator TrmB